MWPSLRVLLLEALNSLAARPGRLLLVCLGPLLGVASLVGTLGVASTASNTIVTAFDALAATEVHVAPAERADGADPADLPWSPNSVNDIQGVTAAASYQVVRDVVAVQDPLGHEVGVDVVRAGELIVPATAAMLRSGRGFDWGHVERGDRVALVGAAAARQLQVDTGRPSQAVLIGGVPYDVIGVVESVERQPELLNSVIVPWSAMPGPTVVAPPDGMWIDTQIGAAEVVASQAAVAISPAQPEAWEVVRPPEPTTVRASVDEDTQILLLILGGLSLVVGGLVIANAMLVAVNRRVSEIGVRRSLGAPRAAVSAQFLLEAMAVGGFGGLVGSSVGVVVTVGVAFAQGWDPVLDPRLQVAGPVLGAALGMVAGGYPAWRAASVDPATALRSG